MMMPEIDVGYSNGIPAIPDGATTVAMFDGTRMGGGWISGFFWTLGDCTWVHQRVTYGTI